MCTFQTEDTELGSLIDDADVAENFLSNADRFGSFPFDCSRGVGNSIGYYSTDSADPCWTFMQNHHDQDIDPGTSTQTNLVNSLKTTTSVHDVNSEKPPFGARSVAVYSLSRGTRRAYQRVEHRFLTNDSDVWSHNAWDHVPPPEDQVETIEAALERQRSDPVHEEDKAKYNEKPARHWSVSVAAVKISQSIEFL